MTSLITTGRWQNRFLLDHFWGSLYPTEQLIVFYLCPKGVSLIPIFHILCFLLHCAVFTQVLHYSIISGLRYSSCVTTLNSNILHHTESRTVISLILIRTLHFTSGGSVLRCSVCLSTSYLSCHFSSRSFNLCLSATVNDVWLIKEFPIFP